MTKRMVITLAAAFLVFQLWASWGSSRTDPPPAGKDGTPRETSGRALAAPPPGSSAPESATKFDATEFIVSAGTVRFDFDRTALQRLGATFMVRGAVEEAESGGWVSLAIDERSTFALSATQGIFKPAEGGHIATHGAFFVGNTGERVVIGNMRLVVGPGGRFALVDTLNEDAGDVRVFDVASAMVDFFAPTLELQIQGEVVVDGAWAARIARPGWGGARIGTVTVKAKVVPWVECMEEALGDYDERPGGASAPALARGPDILVGDLQSVASYGHVGDIHAYAVGTNACNIGDERASWIASTNEHPVILQNMYRLKDDAFEQIGMSWVKHGFYAVSSSFCTPCNDPTNGTELGVGCSDPYSASLNGSQGNMSKLSDIDPYTGVFPYPWDWTPYDPIIGKRLQVHTADLDPALNVGAVYFIEGHYITADEALAGNWANNASYRPAAVTGAPSSNYTVTAIGATVQGEAAVRAWQDTDPDVVETDIRVSGEGIFILAAKAIDLGNGVWRYSYALQNLNSHRSGGSFTVPLPGNAVVTNVGFHDVDYHSGEAYDLTDWSHVIEPDAITWFTDDYAANPNANALRYSTLYSFRFDANIEPIPNTAVTLGLFRPGIPGEVSVSSVGPDDQLVVHPPSPADPPHDILKNRYISVDPTGAFGNNPPSMHIRVEVDGSQVAGQVGNGPWWATAPVNGGGLSPATCISVLSPTKPATAPDFGACPTVHLTGCPVVPTTTYSIQAEVDGVLSTPALFDTQAKPGVKWKGDCVGFFDGVVWTPPNGVTSIDDAVAAIKTYQNPTAFNATHLSVTDMVPNLNGEQINLQVNIADVFDIILGFQGQGYPGNDLTQCP